MSQFENLPENVKEAILSGAENTVSDISRRYKIEKRKIPQITELVRNVLMGNLSPEELPETLKGELEIEKFSADKIYQEIKQFVLQPAKESLVGFTPGERSQKPGPEKETAPKETPTPQEKKPGKRDIYRETFD